jgi:uncharacterized protein (UPF0261 family)
MSHNTAVRSTNEQHKAAAFGDDRPSASELMVECFTDYARERPEVVALWAFGIGFVLGWKLKPW